MKEISNYPINDATYKKEQENIKTQFERTDEYEKEMILYELANNASSHY
jgi:hypothetical protein